MKQQKVSAAVVINTNVFRCDKIHLGSMNERCLYRLKTVFNFRHSDIVCLLSNTCKHTIGRVTARRTPWAVLEASCWTCFWLWFKHCQNWTHWLDYVTNESESDSWIYIQSPFWESFRKKVEFPVLVRYLFTQAYGKTAFISCYL